MSRITRNDIELLAQSRTKARFTDLSLDERQAYRNIHHALEELSRVAVAALGGEQRFVAKLTSGFSVESGVRGYLPKDLWFGAYNRHNMPTFVGMPQVFAIVSTRGVEVGLAATIHPNDFSTAEIRNRVKAAAPAIFAAMPAPGSSIAIELAQGLSRSEGIWFFRRKTRLPPHIADFANLEAWLTFLSSPAGANWGSGSVSRYIEIEELDRVDLETVVGDAATLFAPLMQATVPSADDRRSLSTAVVLEELEPPMPLAPEEAVRPALEEFLARFQPIRGSTPFGRHSELWPLMDRLKAALAALPPLQAHPQVKVSWSLGAGVWATVPWIALMDERETSSTQRGLYVVFLFPQDLSGVYLTLNQGVTELVQQHGRSAGRQALARRAYRARTVVPELAQAGFHLDDSIDLQTDASLGTDYEHSTIAYKFYPVGAVPSDSSIAADLEALLTAYVKVLAAGNLSAPGEGAPVAATTPRVWLWSPGEGAAHWDELYERGLMAIGWDEIGDLRRYATQQAALEALVEAYPRDGQPSNDALACYEFTHVIRPGDIVFAKRGRSTIVGHGVVTGDYSFDPSRAVLRSVRAVRWVARGAWQAPFMLPTKTLTNPTLDAGMLDALWAAVGAADTDPPEPLPPPERNPFTVDQAMAGLFMPRSAFERTLEVWRHKRNLILQGAPGVGKSFVARRLAYALMRYEDPSRVRTVQFHQAYAYEDFVQGFRPNGAGFGLREGVFLEFCRRAQTDPDQTYVFIIDEINRGNLSKILGELMLLIEPDKRSPEWAVKLAYAEKADERFYVPPNVFLLGMMNTADRSLAVVDYALRRRFAFVTVEPGFQEASFKAYLAAMHLSDRIIDRIRTRMGELNTAIAADRSNLGAGFCIGHSFFSSPPAVPEGTDLLPTETEESWYRRVIETEIAPLLEEYWFDDPTQADAWRSKLLA